MSVARVWQRILNVIAPGRITATDDTGSVLMAQITIGQMETSDRMPILQQFGFASVPPNGSDVALLYISGDRSNGQGVATNHQGTRYKGKVAGETVVFNAFGMSIYLSQTGIVINPNGIPVTLNGDLHVTGAVTAGYGTADQVNLQTHKHGTGTAAAGTSIPTAGT